LGDLTGEERRRPARHSFACPSSDCYNQMPAAYTNSVGDDTCNLGDEVSSVTNDIEAIHEDIATVKSDPAILSSILRSLSG
jgi:hypothetical protein